MYVCPMERCENHTEKKKKNIYKEMRTAPEPCSVIDMVWKLKTDVVNMA